MNVNEDNSDNEDGISILEKIVKIEDFEEKMLDSECVVINVLHTGVQTDFISEIE